MKNVILPEAEAAVEKAVLEGIATKEQRAMWDDIEHRNWLAKPTRVFTITINFANEEEGMIVVFKVLIRHTEEGLYLVDYTFERIIHRDISILSYLIFGENFVLFLILLHNIKSERQDRELVEKAKKLKDKEKRKELKIAERGSQAANDNG